MTQETFRKRKAFSFNEARWRLALLSKNLLLSEEDRDALDAAYYYMNQMETIKIHLESIERDVQERKKTILSALKL